MDQAGKEGRIVREKRDLIEEERNITRQKRE